MMYAAIHAWLHADVWPLARKYFRKHILACIHVQAALHTSESIQCYACANICMCICTYTCEHVCVDEFPICTGILHTCIYIYICMCCIHVYVECMHTLQLNNCISICLSASRVIELPTFLPICLSIDAFYLSIYLPIYLSVCLSIYPPIHHLSSWL